MTSIYYIKISYNIMLVQSVRTIQVTIVAVTCIEFPALHVTYKQ